MRENIFRYEVIITFDLMQKKMVLDLITEIYYGSKQADYPVNETQFVSPVKYILVLTDSKELYISK